MSKKLLLADDSITIQKVVGITFANEDYELTVVDNGDAGLETARRVRPDLILADVFMPGKNGYELCAAVKQDPSLAATPLLLLTGTFEPFDENKARAAGADSWIAKPFESQALIDRVEELLRRAPLAAPAPVQPAAAPAVAVAVTAASADDLWGDELQDDGGFETSAAPAADAWPTAEGDDDLWGGVALEEEVVVANAPAAVTAVAPGEALAASLDDTWGDLAEELAPASMPAAAAAVESTAVYAGTRPVAIASEPPPVAGPEWDEFDDDILSLDDSDIIEEELIDGDAFAGAAAPDMDAESELFDPFADIDTAPVADDSWDAAPPSPVATAAWDELAAPPAAIADAAWELTDDEEPLAGEAVWTAPAAELAEDAAWGMESADAPAPSAAVTVPEPAPAPTPVSASPMAPISAPLPPTAVDTRVAALSEEDLTRIVEKVCGSIIERLAPSVLEKVVWEVVPDLAEAMIRDEIRSIKENVR